MASDEHKKQLMGVAAAIQGINQDKLLRKEYGEASLEKEFLPRLDEINKKMRIILQHMEELEDDQLDPIISQLNNICEEMRQQAGSEQLETYVENRGTFLIETAKYLRNIRLNWPPVVAAVMEARGLLDDEDVLQVHERTIQAIRVESEDILQKLREQGNNAIQEAEAFAKNIVGQARSTAAETSMEDAQKQFRNAQEELDKRVKLWGILGGVSIGVFIVVAVLFMRADLPDEWRWEVIYHSSIRVSILTAAGTAAAFCLKIFRAHLHMSEKNRHRQRIANSMTTFLHAAVTSEQRDLILGQLVESIAQFGNSGLVQRDEDHFYRSRTMVDPVIRALSPNRQNEG